GVIGWDQVAGSLALIVVAVALSWWRGIPIQNEIAWAVFRSFVQLVALGYVIKLIFDARNVGYVLPLLAVMIVFGSITSRNRAPRVPGGFPILLASIAVAVAGTVGLALAVGASHA